MDWRLHVDCGGADNLAMKVVSILLDIKIPAIRMQVSRLDVGMLLQMCVYCKGCCVLASVCLSVCLSVHRITQKVVDEF